MYTTGAIQMIEKYPDSSDLYEVISSKTPYESTRKFFKKNGIFFVSNTRKDIAEYGCRFFLGHKDYWQMKQNIDIQNSLIKLSAIEIKSNEDLEAIRNVFQGLKGKVLTTSSNLRLTQANVINKDLLNCEIKYDHRVPGNLELLRKENKIVRFRIENKENRKIVLVINRKNEDYRMVKEALEKISKECAKSILKMSVQEITLDRFPIRHRIEFFDRLISFEYKDLRFEDVIYVRLGKGKLSASTELDSDLEEIEEQEEEMDELDEEIDEQADEEIIPEEDLKQISEALLKGTNLRSNKIVKKFEKSGYYFTGVTIKLSHTSEPLKLDVGIYFKPKPQRPEISLVKAYEIIDEKTIKTKLADDIQEKYIQLFWNAFQSEYFKFLQELSN